MINDGATELERFSFDEYTVSVRVNDCVRLEIVEERDYGDWVYLTLSAEEARRFGESILVACDLVKGQKDAIHDS